MARKKEYLVDEAVSRKRDPRQQSSPSNDANCRNVNNAAWKQKISKRRDQASAASSSGHDVYDVGDLRAQLGSYGLTLRDIPGDGNCLFRALGDQLDGHSLNHMKHRMDTVRYMIAHRMHFEPFVDIPFDRYMDNLSRPGTYAGQDALVAFARLHKVNIVIHQLNSPLWQIEGGNVSPHAPPLPELHLSYHNGEHYSSVRRFGDQADAPAHIRIFSQITGATEVPCCASQGTVCRPSSPVTSLTSTFVSTPALSSFVHSSPSSHPPEASDSIDVHNEDEFLLLVQEVMMRSGCPDTAMATEALLDNGGEVEQTVNYLVSLALMLKPIEEQIGDDVLSERDSINKDLISDVTPAVMITNRRSVGEGNAEMRGRQRAQDKSRIISTVGHEKKAQKRGKGTTKTLDQQHRDAAIERDLRFLTL